VGQGSIKKIVGPLRIFATVEASNFKFGTQIWFGTSLPKKMFRTKIGGGLDEGTDPSKTNRRSPALTVLQRKASMQQIGLPISASN